jgi:chromosome segregation ATPase
VILFLISYFLILLQTAQKSLMCLSRCQDLETRYSTIESELRASNARFLKIQEGMASYKRRAQEAELAAKAAQSQLETEKARSSGLEDQLASLNSQHEAELRRLQESSYAKGMSDAAADFLENQMPEIQTELVGLCWKAALEAAQVPRGSPLFSRVPTVTELENREPEAGGGQPAAATKEG